MKADATTRIPVERASVTLRWARYEIGGPWEAVSMEPEGKLHVLELAGLLIGFLGQLANQYFPSMVKDLGAKPKGQEMTPGEKEHLEKLSRRETVKRFTLQ